MENRLGIGPQKVKTPIAKWLFAFFVRCLLTASLCINISYASQLVIIGLSEEQAENVKLVAGDFPTDERLVNIYVELLPSQTRKALAAFGYFDPEIDVKRTNVDGEQIITLNINAGEPVLITSISVDVTGPAKTDPTFRTIRRNIPLKQNAIFLSSDYEATKDLWLDAAQANGYFDFKFVTNTVLVSRKERTAVINLIADSGPRFTFGQIIFDQNVFSDQFMSRWVPFAPNAPYEASKISEFTKNLQESGYFSSVRVSPQRDVRYGPTVPIQVSLTRKDENQIGIGLGFEDDVGVRGKLTWGKPVINRHGHSADAELSLSEISQAVSFSYRIPRKVRPLDNYWGIEYGLKQESDDGVKSLLSTLNFQRVRRFDNDWIESLFIRWERESSTIADIQETTDLVLPGFRYSRNRSKGFPFITWGQSSSLLVLGGHKNLLSTIDFLKVVVDFKYIRAISSRNTLIFSLQYGAISSNEFDRVPASQRFFAGGDRSIRGYRYRSVSPVDEEGNLIGGRFIESGSAEYNYRFADRWSLAIFADAGRAFNDFSTSQKIGAGVGVRWQSPVGPFRLDIARPINEDENGLQLHISLGPDL